MVVLLSLPHEVLLRVFMNLDPSDILHLLEIPSLRRLLCHKEFIQVICRNEVDGIPLSIQTIIGEETKDIKTKPLLALVVCERSDEIRTLVTFLQTHKVAQHLGILAKSKNMHNLSQKADNWFLKEEEVAKLKGELDLLEIHTPQFAVTEESKMTDDSLFYSPDLKDLYFSCTKFKVGGHKKFLTPMLERLLIKSCHFTEHFYKLFSFPKFVTLKDIQIHHSLFEDSNSRIFDKVRHLTIANCSMRCFGNLKLPNLVTFDLEGRYLTKIYDIDFPKLELFRFFWSLDDSRGIDIVNVRFDSLKEFTLGGSINRWSKNLIPQLTKMNVLVMNSQGDEMKDMVTFEKVKELTICGDFGAQFLTNRFNLSNLSFLSLQGFFEISKLAGITFPGLNQLLFTNLEFDGPIEFDAPNLTLLSFKDCEVFYNIFDDMPEKFPLLKSLSYVGPFFFTGHYNEYNDDDNDSKSFGFHGFSFMKLETLEINFNSSVVEFDEFGNSVCPSHALLFSSCKFERLHTLIVQYVGKNLDLDIFTLEAPNLENIILEGVESENLDLTSYKKLKAARIQGVLFEMKIPNTATLQYLVLKDTCFESLTIGDLEALVEYDFQDSNVGYFIDISELPDSTNGEFLRNNKILYPNLYRVLFGVPIPNYETRDDEFVKVLKEHDKRLEIGSGEWDEDGMSAVNDWD